MTTEQNLNDVVRALARISEKGENPMAENVIADMLSRCMNSLRPEEAKAREKHICRLTGEAK